MNAKYLCAVLILLLGAAASNPSRAQITFSEDFTGANSTNSWYFFNGACLTAGTSTVTANPGSIPGCSTVLPSYYAQQANHDPALVGGYNGFLGATAAPSTPDPVITTNGVAVGYGALRFTNGAPYGHNESGAILSQSTFSTGAGIEVTFKTVTYHGDSGGPGGDGADGISFFLMDGSKPPGLGAFGGSLAYSCSNNNPNYDGLNGGYIGLGIDEFGNFLNGANLVAGYTAGGGTNVATGDNTAYGYGYKPGRIGLRGAGSVSWAALNGAYGANPGSSVLPYYPASLTTSCAITGGVYSAATNNCIDFCPAGATYDATTNVCNKTCPNGGPYYPATDTCGSCTSVNGTYNPATGMCTGTNQCATGSTYYAAAAACEACPATGYIGGTYSNGTCTKSCPPGNTLTGSSCYPTGDSFSGTSYCPSGQTIQGTTLCYPSSIVAGSRSTTAYCATAGQSISGSSCYPTGDSFSGTTYCPSGSTIQGTTLCYPAGLAAASRSTTAYCATGQSISGSSCYPTGDSFSGTNYCASGFTLQGTTLCYPSTIVAASRSTTAYCATAGQSISGSSCYPTGDSNSGTGYCPSGSTIQGTTLCYPTGLAAASRSTTAYCATGQSISGSSCYPTGDSNSGTNYCASGFTLQGTTLCYPSGLASASRSTTNYCPTGQTITGTSCYPTGNVYGAGFSCPTGDNAPTIAAECCPSGYTLSGSNCTKTGFATVAATAAAAVTPSTAMSASLTMTAATPMSAALTMAAATPMSASLTMAAATPMTAATVMATALTVPANQSPTLNTTPAQVAVQTTGTLTGNTDALYAVQNTCKTGTLYNYSAPATPTSAGTATLGNPANTAGILDYAPIPNAYKELTTFQIANEAATTRGAATPIFYDVKITQDGLLSMSYSTGGAYSFLIKDQSITNSNGPLPSTFRVGFAGSTGGDTNIHEIMCFKAASASQSGSSATVNEKQAAKVQAGTQAYFAYYNPTNWTGTVTANTLINNSDGSVSVSTTANWDASCWLTSSGTPGTAGTCIVPTGTVGGTPTPANRVMLTWDTTKTTNGGISFEWASLNSAQQTALTVGDVSPPVPDNLRLNYLRGDRTNEITQSGAGLYRRRDAVLGDIVDSSPTWVGPPSSPYTATWQDRLYPTTPMPENTSPQSYVQFSSTEQTRQNVVYVGDNDGFLHGFRAGSFNTTGTFVANGTTPNDGQEVLAYMPGSTLSSLAAAGAVGGCTNDTTTGTLVQQIHGLTPTIGTNPLCVQPLLDYSNSQYGHNFFVDATPGSGDLYYANQWHTWLVGGLGAGGAAIYALDVTDPSTFAETNPSTVIGEWNPTSIVCANTPTGCGVDLGNTFGTPQIRRLHNGNWGAIFGNGFGSQTGDAGIYVMSIDSTTGAATFYYLSITAATGTPAGGNGIGYTTPADLDGDHITDYVYAGDLNGNVWRFDLTSSNPNNWGVTNAAGTSVNAPAGGGTAAPLFTTQSGQPITTQLLVISTILTGQPRLLIEFGTGARTQITNVGPETFASGTQSLYGVWDWNLTNWNAIQPGAPYIALATSPSNTTGLTSPYTLTASSLQAQTLTANAATVVNGAPPEAVDGTNYAVCWQGSSTCGSGNTEFGWYLNLIGGNPSIPSDSEQIIFNPVFYQGAFVVNSIVPANNALATCSNIQDIGYTYAINVTNGGVFNNTFPTFTMNGTIVTDANEAAVQTNATGSVYIVSNPTSNPTSNIIYQTLSGNPGSQEIHVPSNVKAKRLTWIEKR
jgi:type IV pilus assembly protein PilY1